MYLGLSKKTIHGGHRECRGNTKPDPEGILIQKQSAKNLKESEKYPSILIYVQG